MKRFATAVILISVAAAVFASGVENKTNMSTGYLRNPSRNTEAKRPEASYYNVAGTAFMADGLYIEAGNQFVFKEYGNEMKTGNVLAQLGINDYYSNDETTVWFYPDADFVYKHNNYSIFGNFGVYAGGGSLEYSEGTSATTMLFGGKAAGYLMQAKLLPAEASSKKLELENAANALAFAAKNHKLNVTSITYGGQLGMGYLFMDNLSFAAGLRYVHGTQQMEIESSAFSLLGNGGNTISYKANGYTVSGVLEFTGGQSKSWTLPFSISQNLP